jgi:uncharacterized protein YbjT (DUF2867 family)
MVSNSRTTILVTGATGNVGHNVVSQLVSSGVHVRALTRNPAIATLPEGVEIAQGDLTDPSKLEPSLIGIESVFLLCRGFSPTDVPVLIATIAKHVRRIVFLSSSAIQDELPVQTNLIGKVHLDVERAIRNSGVEWTFLRPGAFAANALTWWAPQLRKGSVVRWPYANAAWAPIHERDIAAVAVCALRNSGHCEKTHILTGGEVLTQAEQLRAIGDACCRTLKYEEISSHEARQQMGAFMPPFVVDRLLGLWAGMVAKPAAVSRVFEEITDQPPTTFHQWAIDHASDFRMRSISA